MSENTTNLFQFQKRTNAININQDEITDFNSKISILSERYKQDFSNFKDLFTFLTDFAISETDFSGNQEDLKAEIENLKADHEQKLRQAIENYTIHFERAEALENQLNELKQHQQEQFEKELDKSMEMENVLLVPVTPDQKELLIGIAQNRLDKDYETDIPGQPDTPDSIIRKIAFRESYLYNEYKRFYTGL